ncbi:MAG: hypothetical protein SNJ54_00400 [Anaerolineae bacterium]
MIDVTRFTDFSPLKLPDGYFRIFELGLSHIHPWVFLSTSEALTLYQELRRQYPDQHYVPFARRRDTDDVACIAPLSENPDRVLLVHVFATAGWEIDEAYDSFWSWYRDAVHAMIDLEASQ